MGYYLTEPPPKRTHCPDCTLAMMAEAGLRFCRWLDLVGDEDLVCVADFDQKTVTISLNHAFKTYPFSSLGVAGCQH